MRSTPPSADSVLVRDARRALRHASEGLIYRALRTVFTPNEIRRLGPLAFTLDRGNAFVPGHLFFATEAFGELRDADGNLKALLDWGSGLITIDFANQLVAQAVAGTSVVPYLAATKYCQYGIAVTPAYSSGDLGVTTEGSQARAIFALTNAQTATTGNNASALQYATGNVSMTAAANYTEFAVVDTPSSTINHCLDHRAMNPVANAAVGDTLNTIYKLTVNVGV